MNNLAALPRTAANTCTEQCAKQLYFALSTGELDDTQLSLSAWSLEDWLGDARRLPNEMPGNIHDLDDWIMQKTIAVGEAYQAYLTGRKMGAPRRFFSSRSHALCFVNAVAPTKLVDGAWLYGLLPHWQDVDYLPLIRTYLEELGDGAADKNHVVLYKKLMETHGCNHWQQLSDPHFVQGAIQLCLAYQAGRFLPEVIGYNLGYEQLPLHLLITSYELNELGIDPYYFTLHITIDNAVSGHAHKALQSVKQLMPLVGDQDKFYQRVTDGYRLNDLGINTMSAIESFDLAKEVVLILQQKAKVGQTMHSDYCRVAGRTVNDWLSESENIPSFLDALVKSGWINKGEPVQNSKFWALINGDRSEMFGVFSEYEQQVLCDWIELAPTDEKIANQFEQKKTSPRLVSFRAQQRSSAAAIGHKTNSGQRQQIGPPRSVLRTAHHIEESDDFTAELRLFEQQIANLDLRDQAMNKLIELMSPAYHHTRVGLMATRIYSKLLIQS